MDNEKEDNELSFDKLIDKIKTNLKVIIIYIIGSLFYYWSLVRINPKRILCFGLIHFDCFYTIAEFVLISSIATGISIYLIFSFKINKCHIFITVLNVN